MTALRHRMRVTVVSVGVAGATITSLLAAGIVPAAAAPACQRIERVVWTGEAAAGTRQVVVGTPGVGSSTVVSAGLSTDNSDPVASPDHGRVAWTGRSTTTGAFEVFVADADGSNARPVAPGVTSESVTVGSSTIGVPPDWAPRGGRLAWATADGHAVHIADLQGVGSASIASPQPAHGPVWSPDGLRLAWMTGGSQPELVVAAAADGAPVLRHVSAVLWNPSTVPDGYRDSFGWAPDGGRLLVMQTRSNDGTTIIFGPTIVGLLGSAIAVGPGHVGYVGWSNIRFDRPAWSRDGRGFAWSMTWGMPGGLLGEYDQGSSADVYDGTTDVVLPRRSVSWSPDGTRVVGSQWSTFSAVAGSSTSGQIKVDTPSNGSSLDLTHWVQIGNATRTDVAPVWSPQGDRVAWEAQMTYRWTNGSFWYESYADSRIAIRRADGSRPTVVLGYGGTPTWSPTGHLVAGAQAAGYPAGVYAYNTYTGASTSFTGAVGNVRQVSWTSVVACVGASPVT